jgi:hypothetical protein
VTAVQHLGHGIHSVCLTRGKGFCRPKGNQACLHLGFVRDMALGTLAELHTLLLQLAWDAACFGKVEQS